MSARKLSLQNHRMMSSHTILWNILKKTVPPIVIQDFKNGMKGLPPADWGMLGNPVEGPVSFHISGRDHELWGLELGPPSGVCASMYERYVVSKCITTHQTNRSLEAYTMSTKPKNAHGLYHGLASTQLTETAEGPSFLPNMESWSALLLTLCLSTMDFCITVLRAMMSNGLTPELAKQSVRQLYIGAWDSLFRPN